MEDIILKIQSACASTNTENLSSEEVKYIRHGDDIIKLKTHASMTDSFTNEIFIVADIEIGLNESDMEDDMMRSLKHFIDNINQYTITELEERAEHSYISFESSTITNEEHEESYYEESYYNEETRQELFILISKELLDKNEWFRKLMHIVSIKDNATIYAENGVTGAFVEKNGERIELPKDTDVRS